MTHIAEYMKPHKGQAGMNDGISAVIVEISIQLGRDIVISSDRSYTSVPECSRSSDLS